MHAAGQQRFVDALVEALAAAGLREACVCPGSRSTPLVLALVRCPGVRTHVSLDERSAAYFAQGMARASGRPVAVACTSGTAAANLFPAVVEARYANVPLVVLTADRPPELWEWGANQTVDQVGMYGTHARWSVTLQAPPVDARETVRYARAAGARAVATAAESPAGPVHLNVPLREPLVGPGDVHPDLSGKMEVSTGVTAPTAEQVRNVSRLVEGVERGLIVCGPQDRPCFPGAVAGLAERTAFPLLADPLSRVRCGPHDRGMVVDSYDALLREETTGPARALEPEVVIRFGGVPTSRALLDALRCWRGARQVVVSEGPWPDPDHVAAGVVRADPGTLAAEVAAALSPAPRDGRWARRWLELSASARRAAEAELESMDELFEGKVFRELASLLPSPSALFAGNSMPVRDLDAFMPASPKLIRVMANRGASGIDGVLSSALGAATAMEEPLVLVVGDLSLHHDLNGLFSARGHDLNATVVVLNNDGGGIFSFLPQAGLGELFEPYFATPHGLGFENAARMYGLPYERVGGWDDFRRAVSSSVASPGTSIVELPGDRARNLSLHRRVWEAVARAVAEEGA